MKKLKKKLKKVFKKLAKRVRKAFFKTPTKNYDKVVGVGYVGRWNDGQIGHLLPTVVGASWASTPELPTWSRDRTVYKCRITIEVLKDKKGRYMRKELKQKVAKIA